MMEDNNSMVASYKTLRTVIGILGMALPVLVIAFSFIKVGPCSIQGSISDYHNTVSRNIFVGILCAVSCFLFAYNGYNKVDYLIAKLAGVFGILVAIFPTINKETDCSVLCSYMRPNWVQYIHLGSAFLLFICFAYFCLFLFTKSSPVPTRRKKVRNRIYHICGWTIIACLAVLLGYFVLPESVKLHIERFKPILVFEVLMLWAFGFSWFVKGGSILKDLSIEN